MYDSDSTISVDECVVVERDGDFMLLRFIEHKHDGWYYTRQIPALAPFSALVGPFVAKNVAYQHSLSGAADGDKVNVQVP